MQIKKNQSVHVYYKQFKTTMQEIAEFVGAVPQQLVNEACEKKLEIIGPQIWQYSDMEHYHEKPFDLLIGFPVYVSENDKESIKQLPEFDCLSYEHKGNWANFGISYNLVMNYIKENGLKLTGVSREIYHVVDFQNPDNNITEIQMGIKI